MRKTFIYPNFTAVFSDEDGHISLTGKVDGAHGAVSEEIARLDPRFAPIARMHLCDAETGEPMHALPNMLYAFRRDGLKAAADHWRIQPSELREMLRKAGWYQALLKHTTNEQRERCLALLDTSNPKLDEVIPPPETLDARHVMDEMAPRAVDRIPTALASHEYGLREDTAVLASVLVRFLTGEHRKAKDARAAHVMAKLHAEFSRLREDQARLLDRYNRIVRQPAMHKLLDSGRVSDAPGTVAELLGEPQQESVLRRVFMAAALDEHVERGFRELMEREMKPRWKEMARAAREAAESIPERAEVLRHVRGEPPAGARVLADHLSLPWHAIQQDPDNPRVFHAAGTAWLVTTREEADRLVREAIREELWAMKPSFVARFTRGVDAVDIEAMQERMCEGANSALLALVGDRFDDLVKAAVASDGYGPFLSGEHSVSVVEADGREFFIFEDPIRTEPANDADGPDGGPDNGNDEAGVAMGM